MKTKNIKCVAFTLLCIFCILGTLFWTSKICAAPCVDCVPGPEITVGPITNLEGVGANKDWIGVNTWVHFSITGTDKDRCGDPIDCDDGVEADWSLDGAEVSGSTTSKANAYCHHSLPNSVCCRWTTTGVKNVFATLADCYNLADDTTHPQSTTFAMKVVDVDINTDSNNDGTISSSDDPIEMEMPGRILRLNDDDDNSNDTPDMNETESVTNEDDSAEVNLSYSPNTGTQINGAKLTILVASGGSNIKIWSSATRSTQIQSGTTYVIGTDTIPTTIWVEGVGHGVATLAWIIKAPNGDEICRDEVMFWVMSYRTTWDSNGNPTTTNANGTSTVYTYDERYRIRQIKHRNVDLSPMTDAVVDYTVDGVGNRTEIWYNEQGNSKKPYDYDANNRLTLADSIGYDYDWVGNRNPANTTTHTYDIADRLISASNIIYNYYKTGSLYTITIGSSTQAHRTFTYDPRELLSEVNYGN